MMNKISIFNYEAYYLDYLEGSLSPEDTAELLAFLSDHPECQLADEELMLESFASGSETFTFKGKDQLKMTGEEEGITLANVDDFIIASYENQLTASKQLELEQFVAANELNAHFDGFKLTYFEADKTVVYADKAGLKKKTVALAWYWYAAAAAVIAFVFLLIVPANNEINSTESIFAKKKDQQEEINKYQPEEQIELIAQIDNQTADNQSSNRKESTGNISEGKTRKTTVEKLRTVKPGILSYDKVNETVKPLTPTLVTATSEEEVLLAQNSVEMFNPIEPITKAITSKTSVPVDFQKTTPKSDRKGFQLKIGKVEISRISGK